MSYASQQASGLSCWARDIEHIEKAFDFGGMPARNGVTAAVMAGMRFTGVEDVFSGDRNFTLHDGERLRHHTTAVRGTATNPMSRDEVAAKSRNLLSPVIGSGRAERLIKSICDIEHIRDVRSLRPLLQA
jgi:2-methylcitrate dehydratase PrpD